MKSTIHIRQSAFTLIEVLVAMTIFAILAVLAQTGLRSTLEARKHTSTTMDRLNSLQTAFLALEKDLQQLADRPIRGPLGDEQPLFTLTPKGEFLLEFTRAGWQNPGGLPRSSLQRVAYGLIEGRAYRFYWQVLDRAEDSTPKKQLWLKEPSKLSIRVLDKDGHWHDVWPPGDQGALPQMLELKVEDATFGPLTRRLRIL